MNDLAHRGHEPSVPLSCFDGHLSALAVRFPAMAGGPRRTLIGSEDVPHCHDWVTTWWLFRANDGVGAATKALGDAKASECRGRVPSLCR